MASSVVDPVLRMASTTGMRLATNASAAAIWALRPRKPAATMLGLPSLAPLARLGAAGARFQYG
jgi:hypothetical protein